MHILHGGELTRLLVVVITVCAVMPFPTRSKDGTEKRMEEELTSPETGKQAYNEDQSGLNPLTLNYPTLT